LFAREGTEEVIANKELNVQLGADTCPVGKLAMDDEYLEE
jgi:hypothetical protein